MTQVTEKIKSAVFLAAMAAFAAAAGSAAAERNKENAALFGAALERPSIIWTALLCPTSAPQTREAAHVKA